MATPPQVHQATLTGHALQTRHQNLTATVGLSPARPCSLHALAARTEHAAAQRWGWEGNHAISSAAGGAAVPCERALRVVLSGAANFPFPTCWGPLLSTNHAPPKPPVHPRPSRRRRRRAGPHPRPARDGRWRVCKGAKQCLSAKGRVTRARRRLGCNRSLWTSFQTTLGD